MKVLLRKDQKAGMMGMGKISFILDVRAELSDEEQQNIKKCQCRFKIDTLFQQMPIEF